ncbi:Mso1 [Kluyveromyces lactis]|nr:Mso1 [Kluyveromyces lactis]
MSNSNGSGNLWSKVKSGTKSLSSSIQHLAVKTEHDGDTPNSTLVHKALVKYYSSQEPFQGFPAWLGHTGDRPEEKLSGSVKQKITGPFSSSNRHSSGAEKVSQSETPVSTEESRSVPQRRTPGSSAFRGLVSSSNSNVTSQASSTLSNASHNFMSEPSSGTAPRPTVSTQSSKYDSVSSRLMQSRLRMNRINSSSNLDA